jgi:diacylglycerol kinase family enzyme
MRMARRASPAGSRPRVGIGWTLRRLDSRIEVGIALQEPGLIVNAGARAARADPDLFGRLAAALPPGRAHLTRDLGEVGPALDALRAAGADTLVVVGGDGSVGGTLTELLARWPADALPAVALVPGGTVNTIAHSLGARGAPEALVRDLVSRGPRAQTRRPLVSVVAPGAGPRCGMIFANGVAVRWLRMYYDESPRGVAGAASVVARIAGSALVGGALARRTFEAFEARVEVDGAALAGRSFTVLAAGSVTHIGLGFPAFHTAGSDASRFHLAATAAGPARLVAELPALRLGAHGPHSCVAHHSVRRARLCFGAPQPWSLDADLYPPALELELAASPSLRFLVP